MAHEEFKDVAAGRIPAYQPFQPVGLVPPLSGPNLPTEDGEAISNNVTNQPPIEEPPVEEYTVPAEQVTTVAPAKPKSPKVRSTVPGKKSKGGRPKERGDKDQLTSILFPYHIHRALKRITFETDVPMTRIISTLCDDMLLRSYECASPNCGCQFIIREIDGGPQYKSSVCPACGGSKLRRIKYD